MMNDEKFEAEEGAREIALEDRYRWALEQCIAKYGCDFKPDDIEYEMNHEPWMDDVI